MDSFLSELRTKYKHQPTFLQAVEECVDSLGELLADPENFRAFKVMVEPERLIQFRVVWRDDKGETQVNRGWRVQFNSALGPYKGGLRFHPTVDEGVLKFLGFEQVFKNALTGLAMGGGKGGSDFNPRGRSDNEVRSFCKAFMSELRRHIGEDVDVPAGDINVGGREIGYLYGEYKRLMNRSAGGIITGKSSAWSGSYIRPEATGYGCVYIAAEAHKDKGESLEGKKCVVSGSGNVTQYTAEKLLQLGAKVLSMSDSGGVIIKNDGLTGDDLFRIMHAKNVNRIRLAELEIDGAEYIPDTSVWDTALPSQFDLAFPSATQNEINSEFAYAMVRNGCQGVFEGANMPCSRSAVRVFNDHKLIYIPGKAANAGGVAVSGLEMAQNGQRTQWSTEEVDTRLQKIMANIYKTIVEHSNKTLEDGANRAGFLKVVRVMRDFGWV